MENIENILIREVNKKDIPSLIELFGTTWSKLQFDESYFKWSYFNELNNAKGYCAFINDKLVGFRGVHFYDLDYNSKHIKSIQLGDSIVHENCRGMGVFARLNRHMFDKLPDDISIIFNFSVDIAKKAYIKQGWKYNNNVKTNIVIRKSIFTLYKLFKNRKIPDEYQRSDIRSPKEQDCEVSIGIIQYLNLRESHSNKARVKLSKEYLDWKLSRPNRNYKIMKYTNKSIVIGSISQKGSLKVFDIGYINIDSRSKKYTKELLNRIFDDYAVDIIRYTSSFDDFITDNISKFSLPKTLTANFGLRHTFKKNDLLEHSNWSISRGDFDTF